MALIKLDYGVLAMLTQANMSGYDITNKLNFFWKTSHSRVYPVLSKLEKMGYVKYVLIEQTNKPDKKLYNITEAGKNALRDWVKVASQLSVKKDESLLKIFCVHLLDNDVVIDILQERIAFVEKEEHFIRKMANNTKERSGGKIVDSSSETFGVHLATEGILAHAKLELAWCKWAIDMYKRKKADNFFDINFDPCGKNNKPN